MWHKMLCFRNTTKHNRERLSMKKLNDFLMAVLAGAAISIGGTVFLSLDNKVLGALFFCVGLFMVCTLGLNLYTGKVCYLPGKKWDYVGFVGLVWLGNLVYKNQAAAANIKVIGSPGKGFGRDLHKLHQPWCKNHRKHRHNYGNYQTHGQQRGNSLIEPGLFALADKLGNHHLSAGSHTHTGHGQKHHQKTAAHHRRDPGTAGKFANDQHISHTVKNMQSIGKHKRYGKLQHRFEEFTLRKILNQCFCHKFRSVFSAAYRCRVQIKINQSII